jgi:hypothetical protein
MDVGGSSGIIREVNMKYWGCILLLAAPLSYALPVTNLSVNFENWAVGTNYNLQTRIYSPALVPTASQPEGSRWVQVSLVKNTSWVGATNGINGNPAMARSNAWNNGTYLARFGAGSYGNLTRLISPPVDLSSAITATMTFWHA